jgi:hypothetical protein
MNDSTNVVALPAPSFTASETVSRLREDWRAARTAHAEIAQLGMPRVNMLLMGPDGVMEYLLDALVPDLREPIGRWSPGDVLLLPPPPLIGTMVLQEVGAMPLEDQLKLLEWLQMAAGRTQVIATTTRPLLRLVQRGQFLEALYYRLNIVAIDATI